MDLVKEKLKEKMLVFLYVSSQLHKEININTFKRYLYLYFLSEKFFFDESNDIDVVIDKSDVRIPNFEIILNELEIADFIEMNENLITIQDELRNLVDCMLQGRNGVKGEFYSLYRRIKPFINLLSSYDDQFVFTIFFSEPTFNEASERGLNKINTSSSILSELLTDFKKKIDDSKIDDYDILTYWMDYVLKNYYKMGDLNDK